MYSLFNFLHMIIKIHIVYFMMSLNKIVIVDLQRFVNITNNSLKIKMIKMVHLIEKKHVINVVMNDIHVLTKR